MAYQIPPPPEGRFGKWAYQLWDYVAKNRGGYAGNLVGSSPITVGTGTTGTFTVGHQTSGVGAGTFGTGLTWPRFSVDARGHLVTATAGGTLGSFANLNLLALVGAVSGTSTTGTLTSAYTGTLVGAGDVLGTSTTSTFTGALSTTGVVAATYGGTGTFAQVTVDAKGRVSAASSIALAAASPLAVASGTVSHNTSGVTAGTYGGTLGVARFGVSAEGHLTAAANHTLEAAAPLALATGAGTFSWSHNTSGVAAGTYGNSTAVSQVVVDARGHLTFGSSLDIAFPAARVVDGAAPIAVATSAGTFAISHATSGVLAGTFGDGTAVSQVVVDARGHVTSATGVAISFPAARALEGAAPIAVATAAGTYTVSHNTSGAAAGTYGTGGTMVSQVTVDARGHVTAVSNQGISFPAAAGTVILGGDALGTGALNGTTTVALNTTGVPAGTYGGTAGIPRFDISAKGLVLGAANHPLVGTSPILITTGAGTFSWSHATSGAAAGTYGAAAILAQLQVDALGHVTSATNAGTLGTMASFNSLVGAGDLLGTTTTSTFTGALSTTGVAAGTYGAAGTVAQLQVDAKGRITSATGVTILAILPDNVISLAGTVGSNKSYIVGHRLEISSGINWEIGSDGIGMIL